MFVRAPLAQLTKSPVTAVRRLQSDHAESERTFHSIVAHLEQQLHQTAEHAAARSAEAQAHVDLLRNEFSAEREGIAAR